MPTTLTEDQIDRFSDDTTHVFAHASAGDQFGPDIAGVLMLDDLYLPYVGEEAEATAYPSLREAIAAGDVNVITSASEAVDCPQLPRAELAALLDWSAADPAQTILLNAVPYGANGRPAPGSTPPTEVRELADESYFTRIADATVVYSMSYKANMPFFSGDTDNIYESFGEYLSYFEHGVPEAYPTLELAIDDRWQVDSQCIAITSSQFDAAIILAKLSTQEDQPFTLTINGEPHTITPAAK